MFSKIIGQEEAVRELGEEMSRGRLNHSYLLEGPDGCGKMTFARTFAEILLYGDESDSHSLDNHPDYLELPREPRELLLRRFVEREGGTESVDHVPVMPFLHLKPMMGERRVCVIPNAERMRTESANTFLKTLEEPPSGSVIILTTSARDRMLPTVVSRCRRVRIRPLAEEVIAAELQKRGIAQGTQATEIARVGEGSLGAAMEMASGDALENWNWLLGSMNELTPASAVKFGQEMARRASSAGSNSAVKRNAAQQLLDLTALYIRKRIREGLDPRAGAKILGVLWNAGEQIIANVRIELVLQSAALDTVALLRTYR